MKTRDHGLSEKEMELVKLIMAECESTGDIQAKLKRLFAGTIEQMLEAEMDEHLGYEKHSAAGNNSGNSRNGYGKKTISSDYGECEIAVPRDRNGEFEPKIIEKRQNRTDEIEQKIMAMYAKGMSQRDIEDTLREIYGSEISQGLISRITDKILPEVNEWQNRPLDKIYPVVFFDGIVFNSRKDNKIISKCVYSVLGINMEGQKEILGTWISENESASFYASICSDLKNRGVTDIFIACHDNCIYRSDCHSCTEYLPHPAADCPRALPDKKRACLTMNQTGFWLDDFKGVDQLSGYSIPFSSSPPNNPPPYPANSK